MKTPRVLVCYRVAGAACQTGYRDTACASPVNQVFTTATGGVAVAGAVIVPCGECPREVVVVPRDIYDYEVNTMCAPDGTKVRVQAAWDQTAGPSAPPTMAYWDVTTGAAWGGVPSSLTACAVAPVTSAVPIDWCADGQNYTQWVTMVNGLPTGVSTWTRATGQTIADPLPSAVVYTKGACTPLQDEYLSIEVCPI